MIAKLPNGHIPNDHIIYRHFIFQGPQKYTQFFIFGLKYIIWQPWCQAARIQKTLSKLSQQFSDGKELKGAEKNVDVKVRVARFFLTQ
jgi:hypothetical protein